MKLFFTVLCIGIVAADTRPYLPAQKPNVQPKQVVSHVSTVVSNQNVQPQEVPQVQQVHQVQVQNPQIVVTPLVPQKVVTTSQTYKPIAQVITTQTLQPVVSGSYQIVSAGCSVSCNEYKCIHGCVTPTYTRNTKSYFSVHNKKLVSKTPVQKVTVTKDIQTKPIQRTVTIQEHIVPVVQRTVVHTVPVVQRTIVQTVPVVQRTYNSVQYQHHSVVQTPVTVQTSHAVPVKEVIVQTIPVQKKVVQTTVVAQTPETVISEKQLVAPAVVPVSIPAPQKETVAIFPTKAPVQPVQPVKQQTPKPYIPAHKQVPGYRYADPAAH